jgi:two-component system LytT family response regulator
MKYFEEHLPVKEFLRIHRSYIMALKELARLEPYGKETHVAVMKNGGQLPVSRNGYQKLREVLKF